MSTCSQAEFARLHGWNRAYVTELKHRGRLVLAEDGRVDVEASLALAGEHLEAGWAYTNHIPRSCVRVRLACAWPILIGRQTLELLSHGSASAHGKPTKIPRSAVRKVLLRSLWSYPWPRLWNAQWRDIGV